jgi:hypothetical protein
MNGASRCAVGRLLIQVTVIGWPVVASIVGPR